MIIEAMREFFLTCPLFSGKELNINYLGYLEGCCSINPIGSYSVVKSYCDGKRLLSSDFSLSLRCGFDENVVLNLKDAEFMEKVALWIEQQNLIGNMPCLSGDNEAVKMTVTKMPYLHESSAQGAMMRLEVSLIYREI